MGTVAINKWAELIVIDDAVEDIGAKVPCCYSIDGSSENPDGIGWSNCCAEPLFPPQDCSTISGFLFNTGTGDANIDPNWILTASPEVNLSTISYIDREVPSSWSQNDAASGWITSPVEPDGTNGADGTYQFMTSFYATDADLDSIKILGRLKSKDVLQRIVVNGYVANFNNRISNSFLATSEWIDFDISASMFITNPFKSGNNIIEFYVENNAELWSGTELYWVNFALYNTGDDVDDIQEFGTPGLTGDYSLLPIGTAPFLTKIDPQINFNGPTSARGIWMAATGSNWGNDSANDAEWIARGVTGGASSLVRFMQPAQDPYSPFCVRWTGFIVPEFTEDYTLYTTQDDGLKIWVNGVLVTNMWDYDNPWPTNFSTPNGIFNGGPTAMGWYGNYPGVGGSPSRTMALQAGVPVPIKIEWYDNARGWGVMVLCWQSASTPKILVPANRLFTSYSGSTIDRHWTLVGSNDPTIIATEANPKPLYISDQIPPMWYGNNSTSKWLTPTTDATRISDMILGSQRNLLVNGGFELINYNPYNPTWLVTIWSSSNVLHGWTVNYQDGKAAGVNATSVDLIPNVPAGWQPYDGNYSVDLVGSPGFNSSISQVFDTTPGVTYTVNFVWAPNPD